MGPSVLAVTGTVKGKVPINTFTVARRITGCSLRPKSRNTACNKGPLTYATIGGMVRVFRHRSVIKRIGRITPCLAGGLSRLISRLSYIIGEGKGNLVRKVRVAGPLTRMGGGAVRRKLLVVRTRKGIVHFIPPLVMRRGRVSRVVRGLGHTLMWRVLCVGGPTFTCAVSVKECRLVTNFLVTLLSNTLVDMRKIFGARIAGAAKI